MSRFTEWSAGRLSRGRVIFTGARSRLTSMAVRGVQMAEEMGGICVRQRYLGNTAVASSPAVIWVLEADLARMEAYSRFCPQILDVINPAKARDRELFAPQYAAFRNFIVNTASCRYYMGTEPHDEERTWVIPHHHCNGDGWRLPEARLERPRVIGYVGEPEHLHDAEELRGAVEGLGFRFLMARSSNLSAYRQIDIGLAWTRRDELRDRTRSNIKLTNFAAHGIPAVVCEYESYRDVERSVGPVACFASSVGEFCAHLRELAGNEELRRRLTAHTPAALSAFSRASIAERYWRAIDEARRPVVTGDPNLFGLRANAPEKMDSPLLSLLAKNKHVSRIRSH